jgi:hypothetical protein
MPWHIDDSLWVCGTPTAKQADVYQWTAGLTVCTKLPPAEVRRRFGWWQHVPVSDGKGLQVEDYVRARDYALAMLGHGHRVVINCLAGRNRSCLIAALVVMEEHRVNGATAAAIVRERRPNALVNPIHLEWLMSLEART